MVISHRPCPPGALSLSLSVVSHIQPARVSGAGSPVREGWLLVSFFAAGCGYRAKKRCGCLLGAERWDGMEKKMGVGVGGRRPGAASVWLATICTTLRSQRERGVHCPWMDKVCLDAWVGCVGKAVAVLGRYWAPYPPPTTHHPPPSVVSFLLSYLVSPLLC
ncbi:hypothetical protein GQ607_017382 [Colletotrichum asianum]|uniref:Uncharacterized protein n=1 Tax=Colletotrichum asianum TaxID=702518 RepID=A0A8H3VWU4_9PEZI|nr:hypothetical protein GQ607_017382 [Colletotrichum asianum]